MKGSVLSYELGDKATGFLPKAVVWGLVRAAAWVYAGLSPDLAAIQDNMRAALPANATQTQVTEAAKRMIVNFSGYLVDFFYSHRLSAEFFEENVSFGGRDILDEALSKRKGVILASAHLGNWELGGMALARRGYPIVAVALRHRDKRVDEVFLKRRDRNGLRILFFGDSLRGCYTALKENALLGLVGDRLFGEEGVAVDFFGRKVFFPRGPARIALFTGAPVLPVFFVSTAPGRYRLEIGRPLEGSAEETLTGDFASRCEEAIRRHPTQWFVFQRFWETPVWPV